jgi:CHAT domain-containing protein/Tfp pilus assembly protein PilF
MVVGGILRRAALIAFAIITIGFCSPTAKAQRSDDIEILNQQVEQLDQAGKYSEAADIAKRALALAEDRFGPDHPIVAHMLNSLALLYRAQGRFGEAEPLLMRALGIAEKSLGPDDLSTGNILNNLATLYHDQGRYGESEPLYKRALAITEKAVGPDHPDVARDLNNLADLYRDQGRYAEAEPLMKRALSIVETALGPADPTVGQDLGNLAMLYHNEGRYTEAEPLSKRALGIAEKALGPDHPDVATALNNLAVVYYGQGRFEEAESLMKRALAIRHKALGPDHPGVAESLNNLIVLYGAEGRVLETEPLLKRVVTIAEKALGPDHPNVGHLLQSLAELYRVQGRYAEAESLYRRVLTIDEKALAPDHPDVALALNNLAGLYQIQGRYDEAESLFKRALTIREKALGPDHPDISVSFNNLAVLYLSRGDWAHAADYFRAGTGVIIRRTQRGTLGEALTGKRKSETERWSWEFKDLVKATYRLAQEGREDVRLLRDTFQTAQWAQSSEAAQSLAQMAARGAKDDPKLAALVRERQDLVAEWQRRDQARSAAAAQEPEKRNREAEAENVGRLTAIDARIAIIDKELAAKFPNYAALASPVPLPVEEVQAQLGADEVLVLFLDTPEWKPTPEETFIWVVTKTNVTWVRSEIGTRALIRDVSALRCGLDDTNWIDPTKWPEDTDIDKQRKIAQQALRDRCKELMGFEISKKDLPPFDLVRAHALYDALFGQIEDLIKDKHLLIVPSGPLTQLPFQVLITDEPKAALPDTFAGYRDVGWLARQHAITVLPAVSSLKALRELAKDSHASEPYVGFGDPLLDGEPAKYPHDAERSKLAREKRCEPTLRQRVASFVGLRGGTHAMMRSNGGVADVADIRSWPPLPETADELCDVAHDLGVDSRTHVYLGAMATETKIKQLSADGTLAKYKIVHFATHGAVAGEVLRTSEPGLLLTPPDKASEADDGYLTASKIAGLKLDADWVILSACNTASGGAQGAEALSGLARAFFYAGARSLLVSHWEVASDSTVKLITKAVAELKGDPKIGRAEALRRSMVSMITTGKDYETHPSFWAPFVLVGEDGAAR